MRKLTEELRGEESDALAARARFCADPIVNSDWITGAGLYERLDDDYLSLHCAAASNQRLPMPVEVRGLQRFFFDYPEADSFDSRVCGLGRKPETVWRALQTLLDGKPIPLDDPPTWFPDLGLLRFGNGSMHRILALSLWGGGEVAAENFHTECVYVAGGPFDKDLLTALNQVKEWLEPQDWRLATGGSALDEHSARQLKEVAAALPQRQIAMPPPPDPDWSPEWISPGELWVYVVGQRQVMSPSQER